jgi:hypothetical protein
MRRKLILSWRQRYEASNSGIIRSNVFFKRVGSATYFRRWDVDEMNDSEPEH